MRRHGILAAALLVAALCALPAAGDDADLNLSSNFARVFNEGSKLIRSDEPEAALDDYRRALELDPQLATAWYNRGLVHLHAERLEEAGNSEANAMALDYAREQVTLDCEHPDAEQACSPPGAGLSDSRSA